MLQYKVGYKFVDGGVHAQVLDFPAAITCDSDLAEARRLLAVALIDGAETLLELGQALPQPNPQLSDTNMDIEEPIYLHLHGKRGQAAEQSFDLPFDRGDVLVRKRSPFQLQSACRRIAR